MLALTSLGRNEEVLKWSDYAIRLYRNNHLFYFLKAEVLYYDVKNLDGAIEFFEKGFSLVDTIEYYAERDVLIWALENKAKKLLDAGNYREAADVYDKILYYDSRKFEAIDNIDWLVKKHKTDYEYSENYKKSLKLRIEIKNRFRRIDKYLKSIQIGEYNKKYINACSEFKEYESIDDYIRDIVICLMDVYNMTEENAKDRVKYAMENVKNAYEHGEDAYDFAIVYGYSCG